MMNIRNYIKSLLALKCITIAKLAIMMSEKTGENYTPQSISHKLRRESLSLKEAFTIADLIGCELKIIDKE